jgi:hypothetical protein
MQERNNNSHNPHPSAVQMWTHYDRSHTGTQQQQPQSTSQRCSKVTYHPITGGAVNTKVSMADTTSFSVKNI